MTDWSRRYASNLDQTRVAIERASRMLIMLDAVPYVNDSNDDTNNDNNDDTNNDNIYYVDDIKCDGTSVTATEHFDDLRYAAYALSTTLMALQPQSINRRLDARNLRRGVVRQLLQELIIALAVGDIADAFDYGEQIKQAVYEYRLAHEAAVANERAYMETAGSDLEDSDD